MSMIEKIRGMQQARVKEELARISASETERLAEKDIERQKNEAYESRLRFVSKQTEKVLSESGVLEGFSQIENALLRGKFKNHSVIFDPKETGAWIVWSDEDFKYVSGGGISGNRYHYIYAGVDADTEVLTIIGSVKKILSKCTWTDKELVEQVLVDSFINAGYRFFDE